MLRIGWAEVDYTPVKPVLLRGQFYQRITSYAESSIQVTAMALSDEENGGQMVFCSLDLCAINAELMQRVRELCKNADGLDPSNIILCATHIHTGPIFSTGSDLELGEKFLPDGYRLEKEMVPEEVMKPEEGLEWLAQKTAEAVCLAWERRAPSYFTPEFGRAVVGHCRRIQYKNGTSLMYGDTGNALFDCLEGSSDSGIELLYLFNTSRELTGIVVNVACPAQVLEHHTVISSDFWGKVRKLVKKAYGEHVCVLALCGAAGDQSPRDMVRQRMLSQSNLEEEPRHRTDPSMMNMEGTEEIGKRIFHAIDDRFASAKAAIREDAAFYHQVFSMDFPVRRVTEQEYEEAKKQYHNYLENCGKTLLNSFDMEMIHVCAGVMDRYVTQDVRTHFTSEVHVMRLGDIAFATNPFELFLDYGDRIKSRSGAKQTFLAQLSCGDGGYLPTEKAIKGGHYSAYVSSGVTGSDGGNDYVETVLQKIEELMKK